MRSRRPQLVTVLTALAATASLTSPAHGETYRGTDRAHDVWRLTRAGDGDDYHAEASRKNPDILRASVRHGRSRLVFRVKFDDIFVPPARSGELRLSADIRSDARRGDLTMSATQRRRQGRVTLFNPDRTCQGTSRIDYHRDVVTVKVRTACLKDPEWVRVSFRVWSLDHRYVWEDQAFTSAKASRNFTPKIFRG